MKSATLSTARLEVDHAGTGVVSHDGVVLLARVAETSGLVEDLTQALAPWRAPTAVLDPGHMPTQLALAVAAGRDRLFDICELGGADTIIGPVSSHATVSLRFTTLFDDVDHVESVAHQATSRAREYVWNRAEYQRSLRVPSAGNPIAIDIGATLITANSETGHADPTYEKGYAPLSCG